MLDLTVKDVHPLSDFKRRTAEFLGRLRKHRVRYFSP
jgi:hypothetical protein